MDEPLINSNTGRSGLLPKPKLVVYIDTCSASKAAFDQLIALYEKIKFRLDLGLGGDHPELVVQVPSELLREQSGLLNAHHDMHADIPNKLISLSHTYPDLFQISYDVGLIGLRLRNALKKYVAYKYSDENGFIPYVNRGNNPDPPSFEYVHNESLDHESFVENNGFPEDQLEAYYQIITREGLEKPTKEMINSWRDKEAFANWPEYIQYSIISHDSGEANAIVDIMQLGKKLDAAPSCSDATMVFISVDNGALDALRRATSGNLDEVWDSAGNSTVVRVAEHYPDASEQFENMSEKIAILPTRPEPFFELVKQFKNGEITIDDMLDSLRDEAVHIRKEETRRYNAQKLLRDKREKYAAREEARRNGTGSRYL